MSNKYFVWIKGFNGKLEPQIWSEDIRDTHGNPAPFIFKRKLEPYEENLGLDTLAKFYENEAKV
jgi:hypothetical protein